MADLTGAVTRLGLYGGPLAAIPGEGIDLAQTANVALSGTIGVTGDIEITDDVLLDIEQTANAALTGVIAVTGDIEIGTSFDIAQTADVALSGVVAVSGDLQFSTDPIPEPAPRVRFAAGRRNYIYKGKKYHNLTNEQLVRLIREDKIDITREDIRVTYKGKKPHPVSRNAWAELQETMKRLSEAIPETADDTDDEDIEAILSLL